MYRLKTVPGISSFNGSASRLGIALADGDDHVAIDSRYVMI